jgi:hypothetical protein
MPSRPSIWTRSITWSSRFASERLERALERAQASASPAPATLVSRIGDRTITVPVSDVCVLVAEDKYTVVHHAGGMALIEDSLVSLEERFPSELHACASQGAGCKAVCGACTVTPTGRSVSRSTVRTTARRSVVAIFQAVRKLLTVQRIETSRMIKIATRKSCLHYGRANMPPSDCASEHPDLDVELVPLSTRGDEVLDRSLSEIGGKGVFLKELEKAILDGRGRYRGALAQGRARRVAAGVRAGRVPAGGDWADWWITRDGRRLRTCRRAVGSAPRACGAKASCCAQYPELEIVPVRGNVQTRLAKLDGGEVDALILAAAGTSAPGNPSVEHWLAAAVRRNFCRRRGRA